MKPDEFGFPVCVGATGNQGITPCNASLDRNVTSNLFVTQKDKDSARAKKAAAQEWQRSILRWNQKHRDAGLCLGFVFALNQSPIRNFAFVYGRIENGLLQRPFKILDRSSITKIPEYKSLGTDVIDHILEVSPDTCPSLPRLVPTPRTKNAGDGRIPRRSYW